MEDELEELGVVKVDGQLLSLRNLGSCASWT